MPSRGKVTRLNSIDKALLALDAGNERMVFHLVLTILGEIEPAKLRTAVCLAMHAHPSMRSVVRETRFGCFREERTDFDREVLTIRDISDSGNENGGALSGDGRFLEWINRPLNLKQDVPLRVILLRRTPHESMVVFTFHHSAVDGVRALRFAREVIGRYNEESIAGLLREEDSCRCHRRDEVLSLVSAGKARTKHFYPKLLQHVFHRFVIAALSPPARVFHDRCERNSGDVCFLYRTLYPPELSRLVGRAETSSVSLNDVLLACCFSSIEKWNLLHARACRKISVMVPVDVGRRSSVGIISNQVSYISPATTRKDRAHPASLLKKTAGARANLMRNGSHLSIIYLSYLISFLPLPALRAVARFLLLTRIYIDSILLTNLGSIWPYPNTEGGQTRLGKAVISEITGITPVITPFRMSILASTYNGALNISLTYKACLISREKAQAFLDLYIGELLGGDVVEEATVGRRLAP